MPLAHENWFLVSWMDSVSDSGGNKWGPRLTSSFLQSCSIIVASDQLGPGRYENLNIRSELDRLFRGTISCGSLEKLVLDIPRLSSFHSLNDPRLLPAVLRLIDRYTQSNSVSRIRVDKCLPSNFTFLYSYSNVTMVY